MVPIRTILLAAAVAAPWSAPATLSSPHLFVDAPALTISENGSALATWRRQDGAVAGTDGAARTGGSFGPERRLAGGRDLVLGPLAYGRSRALLATVRGRRIAARLGRTDGSFGAARTVARRRGVTSARLAVGSRGDAAVAWLERRARVAVALRRRGGRFAEPLRLAGGAPRRAAVAVGPRGQVLVAWSDRRGTLRTRYRPAGRAAFLPAERIAGARAFAPDLSLAVRSDGRAVVAFSSQRRSEGGEAGPFRVLAALKPPGRRTFGPAARLERRPAASLEPPAVFAAAAGRRFLVAWTGFDGSHHRARIAATGPASAFGPPADVSPAGVEAWTGDLATGPGGRALLAWTAGTGDELAGQVQAALAPPGLPFGPPEAVSADEAARLPAAAFDRAGRPTVVWSNRPAGAGDRQTVAQAATREP